MVDKMFSKDLTIRRKNALKRQHQVSHDADVNLQIKLKYPATQKVDNKAGETGG